MKNKLFLGGLALAVPAIVTPLVCATKTIIANTQTNDVTIDFTFGPNNKNKYTIAFNDNTKTCYMTRIELNENVDRFVVPATCPRYGSGGGEQYALDQILTQNSPQKSAEMKVLDLSQAKNLVHIGPKAFYDRRGGKIRWVEFRGANKLETIDEYAFAYQFFDTRVTPSTSIMDMSDTALTTIGKRAFSSCCENDNCNFEAIIFPKTLTKIEERAFSFESGKQKNRKLAVNKIIFTRDFTDGEIPMNYFGSESLPNIHDEGSRICVPSGTENRYRELENTTQKEWNHIKPESFVASELTYKAGYKGTNNIVTQYGAGGMDSHNWVPFNEKTGAEEPSVSLTLSNTYDGMITLDPTKRNIHWSSKLEPGEYRFTVTAAFYNESTQVNHYVNSGIITISVIEPGIKGDRLIYGKYTGGETKEKSYIFTDNSPIAATYDSVKWTILNDTTGCISVVQDTEINKCKIKWTSFTKEGNYPFVLHCEATTSAGTHLSTSYVIQIIASNIEPLTLTLVNDQGLSQSSYDVIQGNTINLKLVADGTASHIQPKVSSNESWIHNDTGETSGETPITISPTTTTKVGSYQVYGYTTCSVQYEGVTYQYPVISNVVTINVTASGQSVGTKFKVDGGTTQLWTSKCTAGEDEAEWTITDETESSTDTWAIKNISKSAASWCATQTNRLEHIDCKLNAENTGFTVTWDANYNKNQDWIDFFDFNLEITMVKTNTNDDVERTIVLPLGITSTNYATLKSNSDTIIPAIPGKSGVTTDPWYFVLNDNIVPVTDYDITYGIECEDEDDNGLITVVKDATLQTATISWSSELTKDTLHKFKIVAYCNDYFAYAVSPTITIYPYDRIEVTNVPEIIEATAGVSGKADQPIVAKFNGDEIFVKDLTYRVYGAPEGTVTIDQYGFISWTGNIPAQKYNIGVIVEYQDVTTVMSFILNVTGSTDTNTGISTGVLIGATVGAGVGAAALGAGITGGAMKASANKKKKAGSK